eukprot:COSAG01_NODE_1259_length_11009_cov_53.138930_9_plen_141_part_00
MSQSYSEGAPPGSFNFFEGGPEVILRPPQPSKLLVLLCVSARVRYTTETAARCLPLSMHAGLCTQRIDEVASAVPDVDYSGRLADEAAAIGGYAEQRAHQEVRAHACVYPAADCRQQCPRLNCSGADCREAGVDVEARGL